MLSLAHTHAPTRTRTHACTQAGMRALTRARLRSQTHRLTHCQLDALTHSTRCYGGVRDSLRMRRCSRRQRRRQIMRALLPRRALPCAQARQRSCESRQHVTSARAVALGTHVLMLKCRSTSRRSMDNDAAERTPARRGRPSAPSHAHAPALCPPAHVALPLGCARARVAAATSCALADAARSTRAKGPIRHYHDGGYRTARAVPRVSTRDRRKP